MPEKNIRVSEETKERLKQHGNMDDTYDAVVNRALDALEKETV